MRKLFYYFWLMMSIMILNTSSANAPMPDGLNYSPPLEISIEGAQNDIRWIFEELSAKYRMPSNINSVLESEAENDIISDSSATNSLYELAIAFIKKHEGFAGGKLYRCVAGYLTIGYGHVVRVGEEFNEPISRRQADRMLRRDFNRCMQLARLNTNNLQPCQLIAVSHFIYSKGIGKFNRSRLKILIDSGFDPSEEFLKWCKYHTPDGKIVTSNYSLKIRKWEVDMYSGKML